MAIPSEPTSQFELEPKIALERAVRLCRSVSRRCTPFLAAERAPLRVPEDPGAATEANGRHRYPRHSGAYLRGGTLVRCLVHVAATRRIHDQRGRPHFGSVREP